MIQNILSPQILRSRSNILKEWKHKEWWFTGFFLPEIGDYFSFFFARVNVIDQFSVTYYDTRTKKTHHFSKKLWLKFDKNPQKFNLKFKNSDLYLHFEELENKTLIFEISDKNFDAKLKFTPQIPEFTKFENNGNYWYGFFNHFLLQTEGKIRINDKKIDINQAQAYTDHSFGKVPSRCRWHWLEAQNETTAIASLVNYGADSQRYTQIYFQGEWHRLSPDVCFERLPSHTLDHDSWKITSPDLNLTVTPIQAYTEHISVPPILPIFVKIDHREIFVKVTGKVKINSFWAEIGTLWGIVEAHFGRW